MQTQFRNIEPDVSKRRNNKRSNQFVPRSSIKTVIVQAFAAQASTCRGEAALFRFYPTAIGHSSAVRVVIAMVMRLTFLLKRYSDNTAAVWMGFIRAMRRARLQRHEVCGAGESGLQKQGDQRFIPNCAVHK